MAKKCMISILIGLFAMAAVYAAGKPTPEEAKELVQQAVAYLIVNGKENALKEFNKPDGKFVKSELYVFVYNLEGVMMAHLVNPSLIGRSLLYVWGSRGKIFIQEIVELAKTKGSGFIDYTWLNPVTKQEDIKTIYIQKAGDLIICCGVYK